MTRLKDTMLLYYAALVIAGADALYPSPALLPEATGAALAVRAADYGVVGDGVADDTTAFTAALAAAASGSRALHIGATTVKLMTPVTVARSAGPASPPSGTPKASSPSGRRPAH